MKKFLTLIIIILLGFGGYWVYTNFIKKTPIQCEDGFRFNPALGQCVQITPDDVELDFTKIKLQIPGEMITVNLEKASQENQYTANFSIANSSQQGFVSLMADKVQYISEELIVVPFMVNTGGTGQFMYIGSFDVKNNLHLSSVFIGDRVVINSIELKSNTLRVGTKTRAVSEGFTAEPTIPVEIILEIKDGVLNEIIRLENSKFEEIEIKNLPIISSGNSLIVKGAIPGFWYFEAIAQYKIFDNQFNEIGFGYVQALSDWMTEQRVPFELNISSDTLNYKGKAVLIIQSENVQGDEEGEKKVKRMYIPIEIK
jgi:hypothetical protein